MPPGLLGSTLLRSLAVVAALLVASTAARGEPPAAPNPSPMPQTEPPITVGKWPEGVVVTAGSIWVAESGKRRVLRLSPDGAVEATVQVGRLPVSMGVGPDGAPIVLVVTDRRVKRIDPKSNKATTVATLPEHGEAMAVDGDHAFVLLWKGGSSAGSSVLRVDLRTGKTARSADTGRNAFGIAAGGGHAWIAAEGRVAVVRADTMERLADVPMRDRPFEAAFGAGAAFVSDGGSVVRLDPPTRTETARASIGGRVAALAAFDDEVVAAREDGELWRLDPSTLAVRTRLAPASPFTPVTLARSGKVLLASHHGSADANPEHGTLLRIPLE
ncbi:MAG: hypothetical protein AMXMBFR64_41480 [Myxococcales bacterium]